LLLASGEVESETILKKKLCYRKEHFTELLAARKSSRTATSFPGDYSGLEPPETISNSEVKQTRADDSVGFPHVKVGHCQGFFMPFKEGSTQSEIAGVAQLAEQLTCNQ
jgi:hypothetical protein